MIRDFEGIVADFFCDEFHPIVFKRLSKHRVTSIYGQVSFSPEYKDRILTILSVRYDGGCVRNSKPRKQQHMTFVRWDPSFWRLRLEEYNIQPLQPLFATRLEAH
jgi:hypothetical protein